MFKVGFQQSWLVTISDDQVLLSDFLGMLIEDTKEIKEQ